MEDHSGTSTTVAPGGPSAGFAGLKSILLMTDFSPASLSILPYVSTLARRHGSKVYLMHVIPSQSCPLTMAELESAEHLPHDRQRQITELLNVPELADIPHESILAHGDIARALSQTVHDREISIVATATHGRQGLKRMVLGSVAEVIVRTCPCPVLTVGPHLHTGPPPESSIRRILYPTDLSEGSLAAAHCVFWFAREYSAAVTTLHVCKPAETEIAEHLRALLQSKVRDKVAAVPNLGIEPDFSVVPGNPAGTVLQIAKDRHADMIVMGVRKASAWATHRLGSVAYKILAEAECPVLTLHRCA